MQINPYLSFNGQCEAAFKFYEQCLGGQLGAIFRYAGTPLAEQVPADWQDKVMHGSLTVGEPGADGRRRCAWTAMRHRRASRCRSRSRTRLRPSVSFVSWARTGRLWCRSTKTFWAARFGMVVDRFGIPWLINCEGSDQSPDGENHE